MASLVHLTPQRHARRIRRGGVAARSRGADGVRGVFCMAVLPSYALTHQWVRELRRWKPGVLVAVDVRVPDDEPVTVGRYGETPASLPASAAVALIRGLADPRGYEIFVPRALTAGEVRRVRAVRQGIGWRHQPDAHGRRPCSCPACLQPGTPKAARLRGRFPIEGLRTPETKPVLMARLRAATTAVDIIDVLYDLGARSRGGAEELAFLAGHPDPDVREVLAGALERYRGEPARALRARVLATLPPGWDDD